VKWFEPIATAVQVSLCNKWGNEEIPPGDSPQESKEPKIGFKELSISIKNASLSVESKGEGTQPLKMEQLVVSLVDDDEDEKEFLEYLRKKFKARSAVRQALAFEDADFSGTRPMYSGLQ